MTLTEKIKFFLQIAGVFDYVLKIKKIRQKCSRLIAKMISYTKEFHALLVKKRAQLQ